MSELLWPHVTDRLLHLRLANQEWVIPTKPKWRGGDADRLIGFATNSPERMQGFHAEHLLIVMDEASGFGIEIVQALEGIANAAQNYVLAIGNPNSSVSAFYDMTRLPSYHTEPISALTHPNVLTRRELIPGAVSWLSVCDRVRDWCTLFEEPTEETFELEISDRELHIGESEERTRRIFSPNDAFRVRYLGVFPMADQWNLIDRNMIAAAQGAQIPGDTPIIAALDIARTGGDRTVYGLRKGDNCTLMEVIPAADFDTQASMVARKIARDNPSQIYCDAAGIGFGFIDILRGKTECPVISFHGAEEPWSPSDRTRYFNRRSAAYAKLQSAFMNRRIGIPKNDELAEELGHMRYKHTDDGRLQMLRKEEIKKHLGRSPDFADALSLLWDSGTNYEWGAAVSQIVVPREAPTRW